MRLMHSALRLVLLLWISHVDAFLGAATFRPLLASSSSSLFDSFMGTSTSTTESSSSSFYVHIVPDYVVDDETLTAVSSFLVEAYWLGSPRLWVLSPEVMSTNKSPPTTTTAAAAALTGPKRANLIAQQVQDLAAKFQPTVGGSRLLPASFVIATEQQGPKIAGLLCLNELLLDTERGLLWSAEESEQILRQAVANQSPKERKQYKDMSASQLLTQNLLPKSVMLVHVLCNLAVAPQWRRCGIAESLCRAAEEHVAASAAESSSNTTETTTTNSKSGAVVLALKVEADNQAALNLYKNKLGYTAQYRVKSDPALRLDLSRGDWVERTVESLIFTKPAAMTALDDSMRRTGTLLGNI